jgi:hypothetical protein
VLKISGGGDDTVMANIELVRECPTCGGDIDDPVESVVCDTEDEIGCCDESVILTVGTDDAGVVVEMIYTGVWVAKIHQLDEDTQIPWPITVGSEGYSAIVSVDCPNGTPVKIMKRVNP